MVCFGAILAVFVHSRFLLHKVECSHTCTSIPSSHTISKERLILYQLGETSNIKVTAAKTPTFSFLSYLSWYL